MNEETSHLTVGVTGAGGFLGREVCRRLQQRGIRVLAFTRNPRRIPDYCNDARAFSSDKKMEVAGVDAIVHLAGETIMGFWSSKKKKRILESRVMGTRRVVEAIQAEPQVKTLLCASAIGFYGDAGAKVIDEESPKGEGFLSEVVHAWEYEARQAEVFEKRVACFRMGMLLGKNGGAMKKILPIFRFGLGGRLGSGEQWMAGIRLEDAAEIFCQGVLDSRFSGIYNAVMPEPIQNGDFTKLLGKILHRPTPFPVPAFALRLALGELSTLLLFSQRVKPQRLENQGYKFLHPDFISALKF